MYDNDLKKELSLRTEALIKASEVEDTAAARRTVVETVWQDRLDFREYPYEEARRFGYI
jgi:hypothetical protein